MAIVVLCLKRKTICFDVHRRGEVDAYWLQFLCSTGSSVMVTHAIAVRTSFTGIAFLTGRFFNECELEFFSSFVFSSLDVLNESLD